MALSQIEKLKVLADVKRVATSRRDSLNQGITHIKAQNPGESALATQIDGLFASTLLELAATITRVNNAIAGLAITNADRQAYGTLVENDAKSVPN